ncbi:NAD(P)-binding domain-containing protein [Planctomycetes bacterium K23_9]|uniref:Putative oxidoreductase CzcO n=1 Tax=Stieleria marina TaxID=1930275 RepID=A0A517P1C2_9BACT|nr:putative oxidoreductase CzcO [Planctomycetes bacterium K23_9]
MDMIEKDREVDYVIIGAGPAGLQLGYFMERAGNDYVVLESRDRPGTAFELYPRHDKLLSINKVHTGYTEREAQLRYDWNSLLCDDDEFAFTKYSKEYFPSAKRYAQYLCDFAEKFDLNIQYNTSVQSVHPDPVSKGAYVVRDANGNQLRTRCLIVATGIPKPYIPEIPGIELSENYETMSIDPDDFAGQRVLILGKGNSAFETANHLIAATRVTHLCSPNSIKMAWQTHFFGHLRAVNNDFLDTYILKGQNSVLDANVNKIEKVDGEYRVSITFTHAEGQSGVLAYDRVLCCTGFSWDASFFGDGCQPALACEDRLPAMTSAWESTNLPGVFYAGTITQIRDLKKTMSSVLHGFRFNIKSLFNLLTERYQEKPWVHQTLEADAETIAEKITDRVSSAAGLMHQPGFLGDCLVVDEKTGKAKYYETIAVDYIIDCSFSDNDHYYIITMEYGDFDGNLFSLEREPHPDKAYDDAYLHPRIRRMFRGQFVDEHHISESLENDWRVGKHPGERPLIRELDFVGQDDPTKYQHTHRNQFVKFLQQHLSAGSTRLINDPERSGDSAEKWIRGNYASHLCPTSKHV